MKKLFYVTKSKAGAVALCSTIALTMLTSSAFASTVSNTISQNVSGKTWSQNAPEGIKTFAEKDERLIRCFVTENGKGIMIKVENSIELYSTDGGQTWSEIIPDDMPEITEKEGEIANFKNGSSIRLMVKVESGVKQYSTDGGETWSENTPADMPELPDKEGKTIGMGNIETDGIKTKGDFTAKEENGVKFYSTDGGETWSENTPEGMPEFIEKDEKLIKMFVTEDGKGIMVKSENDVNLYSTDGGDTWSENVPDGIEGFKTK